jgi:integrase
MPLNIYRRHNSRCTGGHPEDSHSGELEERSKKWKRCGCPIVATGTLSKEFRRLKTGQIFWDQAHIVITRWETAGCWPGAIPAQIPEEEPEPEPDRVTMDKALASYLADHQHAAANTLRRYGYILDKLRAWSTHKGYVLVQQWTPVDVRECRDSWHCGVRSSNSQMTVIRSFFTFCLANEWISRSPATMVKNNRGRESYSEQKLPFTDAELQAMYDAAETRYGKQGYRAQYRWTGQDLADFISISVYTGLRISDVATFEFSRMNEQGMIWLYTTKTNTPVSTWVPRWLQEMIYRRSLEVGPKIFGDHQTKDLNVITDLWRRKLKRLWKICNIEWTAPPTPHRFRHTFARILLQKGVEISHVAKLMGDTEVMVIRHYAAWIPSRQEKLTAILKDAFTEIPRPGIVVPITRTK